MQWNLGVDTHKGSFDAGVVDDAGREVAVASFTHDRAGLGQALSWIQGHEGSRVIGVEGSGSFGAPLVRILAAAGEDVREVPPMLTHRERRRSPSKGKSDPVDAIAIARVVARGEGLSTPKLSDIYEELKLLVDERKTLVRAKTQMANQTHADLVILRPGYQDRIPKIVRKIHVGKVRKLIRGEQSVRGMLIRDRLTDIDRVLNRISNLERLIKQKVLESGTSLHEQRGISFIIAATILGETGHPSRIHSEAAFAMFNGTAPIQASSGKSNHHRLNRRGNRQLNYAIHTVAMVRSRIHEPSRAFIAKKRAEGKSSKDALRCLKRHISNWIYRQLIADSELMKSAA